MMRIRRFQIWERSGDIPKSHLALTPHTRSSNVTYIWRTEYICSQRFEQDRKFPNVMMIILMLMAMAQDYIFT